MPTPVPIPLSPELLTVEQVAELLGVSSRLVWKLAKEGELAPPVRIRSCTRWRRADVMRYIDQLPGLHTQEASRE